MKIKNLALLLVIVSMLSCQENENPTVIQSVEGRWEQIFEVNGLYESYHFIELKSDGTFYNEMMARDLKTKELIGYRGIAKGSFKVNGEIISLKQKELLTRDYEDPAFINDDTFFAKNELISNPNLVENKYRLVKNKTEMKFICPDEENTGCVEFTTYVKVN